MKPAQIPFVIFATIATAYAVWVVGFSRRWKDDAKNYLRDLFGPNPDDDALSEEARQSSAKLWLTLAAAAWALAALAGW